MSKCQSKKRNTLSTITALGGFISPPSKTETQPMFKSLRRGCLSFSPYLAPVWKVKNLLSQASCHHRGSGSCVGRRSAWGILSVVGPMAGLFTGANGMIYAQWQTHALSHQFSWRRSTKIRVIIATLEGWKGKKTVGRLQHPQADEQKQTESNLLLKGPRFCSFKKVFTYL